MPPPRRAHVRTARHRASRMALFRLMLHAISLQPPGPRPQPPTSYPPNPTATHATHPPAPQRCGVRSLLELLLASPQPPSLAVIAQQGLSPALHHLPGWGVLFAVRAFRLTALHRSLMDWMRRALAGASGGTGEVEGGVAAQAGARPTAAMRPRSGGEQQQQQQQQREDVRLEVEVDVDVGRGHARLADWALADLKGRARPQVGTGQGWLWNRGHMCRVLGQRPGAQGALKGLVEDGTMCNANASDGRSRRPHPTSCDKHVTTLRHLHMLLKLYPRLSLACPTIQTYSLRYAIYHLAHAIAAGQGQEQGQCPGQQNGQTQEQGQGDQGQGRPPRAGEPTADYQQQLDALLLDWGFWQQVGCT